MLFSLGILALLEEARARDHRKLGRELDLFLFNEVSPGMPFWQPNGMAIWNELTKVWRGQNAARGYAEVKTPILFDVELFKQSGHWQNYRENMYFTDVEDRPMGLKPMNCPAHVQLFKSERRSYRDLPVRYSEQGLVHRHEPSGTLHGLLRVRHITQDDAHVFCTEDQLESEIVRCLDFGFHIYDLFGFAPRLELSTRPEKRVGEEAMWDRAEAILATALRNRGLEYDVNPGDGAFYGPKIDLHMTDSIGRSWQLGTVQLDYYMPEQFGLAYTDAEDREQRPVMIHRALMGSFERFIGILTEHYAGEFPVWLTPVQAIVLPLIPTGSTLEHVKVTSWVRPKTEVKTVSTPIMTRVSDFISQWGSTMMLGFFALIALRMLSRSAPAPEPVAARAAGQPGTAGGVDDEEEDTEAANRPAPPPTKRDELQVLVRDNPEMAAALLNRWITNVK